MFFLRKNNTLKCDVALVLYSHMRPLYEQLQEVSDRHLTIKQVFFHALVSAKRVP